MKKENQKNSKRLLPIILGSLCILIIIYSNITIYNEFYKEAQYIYYIYTSICSILLGNAVVFTVLAINAFKKYLVKFDTRYVLTFYINVFANNLTEVIIGTVGQTVLIFLYWLKDTEKYEPYFIIYSLVFYAFCAAPILKVLFTKLDSVYLETVEKKLVSSLYRLKSHYIVIGYGRFGKTVVSDLFETYVCPTHIYIGCRGWFRKMIHKSLLSGKTRKIKKPILFLESILNERIEDVFFCTNVVIVDKNESLFSCVFDHPHFGKIGVVVLDSLNCLSHSRENHKKMIYIPAIVGSANNYSILDLASIENSMMVMSLAPQKDITNIFNAINQKQEERKGIIVVDSTSQEHLLIPQSYDSNISFVHGYRIRGWELGDIVAAHLINKDNRIKNLKILILGSGKQLHFLIEKIWLEIICEKGERADLDMNFFKNNILIVGNDEYINRTSVTMDNCTYWKHEIAYVTNKKVYEEKKENYEMLIPYLSSISYDPAILGPIVTGRIHANHKELLEKLQSENQQSQKDKIATEVTKDMEEPFNKISPYFFTEIPEIIIVSSDSNEEIIKSFNELNSITKKHKFEKDKAPQIIVESNPNIQKIMMELNRENDNNLKTNSSNKTKYPIRLLHEPYPIEFSENVFNSFNDGNNMVRGYVEAMTGPNGVIVNSCVEDKPGAFAKLSFLLSNLKLDEINTDEAKTTHSHLPSFHNTQALPQREGYFCFFSDADLEDHQTEEHKIRIEHNANHIREVFVSSKSQKNKEWLIQGCSNKENSNISRPLIPVDRNKDISGCCVGLTFCPVSTFHDSLEAEYNKLIKDDKQNAIWHDKKYDPKRDGSDILDNERYKNFARIYSCCQGSEGPGAIAVLLSKFMLSKGEIKWNEHSVKIDLPEECSNPTKYIKNNNKIKYDEKKRELNIDGILNKREKKRLLKISTDKSFRRKIEECSIGAQILNLKYVMNVECYNPGFELLKMYGNIVKPPKDMKKHLKELGAKCLQGVVISPVKFPDKWKKYSDELLKLLKEVSGCFMYYDGEESVPDNILIITKEYKDRLIREYIQFEVAKIVDVQCIQGKIDNSRAEDLKFELYDKLKELLCDKSTNKIENESIKEFVDTTLSDAIIDYSKGGKKKDEILKNFITANFTDDSTNSNKSKDCPCPITECPFKSKALYLLIYGVKVKVRDEKEGAGSP